MIEYYVPPQPLEPPIGETRTVNPRDIKELPVSPDSILGQNFALIENQRVDVCSSTQTEEDGAPCNFIHFAGILRSFPGAVAFVRGDLRDPASLKRYELIYQSRLPLAAWVSPDGQHGVYAVSWLLAPNLPVTEIAARELGNPAAEKFKYDLFGYVCYQNGSGDNNLLLLCDLGQNSLVFHAVDSEGRVGKYSIGSLPNGETLYGGAVYSKYEELDENGEPLQATSFALIGRGPKKSNRTGYDGLKLDPNRFTQQLEQVSVMSNKSIVSNDATSSSVIDGEDTTSPDTILPEATSALTPTDHLRVDVFKFDSRRGVWTLVSDGDPQLDSCIVPQGDGGCIQISDAEQSKKTVLIRVNNVEDAADSEYDLVELPIEEDEVIVGINRGPALNGDYHIVSIKSWDKTNRTGTLFLTSVNFNDPDKKVLIDLGKLAPHSEVSINKDANHYPIIKIANQDGSVRLLYSDVSGNLFEVFLPAVSSDSEPESQPKSTN